MMACSLATSGSVYPFLDAASLLKRDDLYLTSGMYLNLSPHVPRNDVSGRILYACLS
jgi:hypothetical protein